MNVKISRFIFNSSIVSTLHTTHLPLLTHQHNTNSFCFWRLGPCQHSAARDTQPSLAEYGGLTMLDVYCELQLTQCCPGYSVSVTVVVVLRCRLRGDCTLYTITGHSAPTRDSEPGLVLLLSTDHINIQFRVSSIVAIRTICSCQYSCLLNSVTNITGVSLK